MRIRLHLKIKTSKTAFPQSRTDNAFCSNRRVPEVSMIRRTEKRKIRYLSTFSFYSLNKQVITSVGIFFLLIGYLCDKHATDVYPSVKRAFWRIVGFAGKRFLRSSSPPPSHFCFALAPLPAETLATQAKVTQVPCLLSELFLQHVLTISGHSTG